MTFTIYINGDLELINIPNFRCYVPFVLWYPFCQIDDCDQSKLLMGMIEKNTVLIMNLIVKTTGSRI